MKKLLNYVSSAYASVTSPGTKMTGIKKVSPIMQDMYAVGDFLFSPKMMVSLFVLTFAIFGFGEVVLANPLLDNALIQGGLDFIYDFRPLLATIGIGAGAARCGYCFIRRSQCDEHDAKKWTDSAKASLVYGGAGGAAAVVIPTVLQHYFGV